MPHLTTATALTSILLTGAIFGFFYAYYCSAMWGLDVTDPRVAIPAMQGINSEVRNAAFMPAFFLTPVALLLTGALLHLAGQTPWWFVAAGVTYLLGGMVLTALVNIPMNEALAQVTVPTDLESAQSIWSDFSPRWQTWNLVRTLASGATLLLAAVGLLKMN